jgi:ubiquinone/menaquinone biosynthesis C-methylase UbiE
MVETFETGAHNVSDRLIELAEIKPGQKVLDIATGIGEPKRCFYKFDSKGCSR